MEPRAGGAPGVAADPPVCPAGWEIGPPHFVGIGSDRSGTTWWHAQLVSHPWVSTPQDVVKEVHFFDQFWDGGFTEADIARYHAYFPRPVADRYLVGEWTPRYMYDIWTPALLYRCAPEARLLVSLRDPLKRYRSQVRQIVANKSGARFRGRAIASALSRSLYADSLERVLRYFPRDQLLILQHERCVAEPEHELRRTYEFLELPEPHFVPADLRIPLNVGDASVQIPSLLEDGIAEGFAADVRRLLEIAPDIDLGLWPSVRDLV